MFREEYKKINDKLQLDNEFVKELEENMKQQKREVDNTMQNYVFSETNCNNVINKNPFIHMKEKGEQRYVIGTRKKRNCIISTVSIVACIGIVIVIGGVIFSNARGNIVATNKTEQVEDIIEKGQETVIKRQEISKNDIGKTDALSDEVTEGFNKQEEQTMGYTTYDAELIENIDKKISAEQYTKEVAEIIELEDKTILKNTILSILNQENGDTKNNSIVLDYAKGSRVIFHGSNYLIVYDLKKKEIQRAILLPNSMNNLPALAWNIQVNEEGNKIKIQNMLSSNTKACIYNVEKDKLSEIDFTEVDWNNLFFSAHNVFDNIEDVSEYTGGILNPECSSNQVINLTNDISCRLTFIAPEWKKEASLAIFLCDESLQVGYIYPVFGQEGIELMEKEGYKEAIYKGQFFNYPENNIDYCCYFGDTTLVRKNGIVYKQDVKFTEEADISYNITTENSLEEQNSNYNKKDTQKISNSETSKVEKNKNPSISNNMDNELEQSEEDSAESQEINSEVQNIDSDTTNINQQVENIDSDTTNINQQVENIDSDKIDINQQEEAKSIFSNIEQNKTDKTKNEIDINIDRDKNEQELELRLQDQPNFQINPMPLELRLQDQPNFQINPMSLEQYGYITNSTEINVYWEIDVPYQIIIDLYNEEGERIATELTKEHTPVQVTFTNLTEEQTYFTNIRKAEESEMKLKEEFQEIPVLISEQEIEFQ